MKKVWLSNAHCPTLPLLWCNALCFLPLSNILCYNINAHDRCVVFDKMHTIDIPAGFNVDTQMKLQKLRAHYVQGQKLTSPSLPHYVAQMQSKHLPSGEIPPLCGEATQWSGHWWPEWECSVCAQTNRNTHNVWADKQTEAHTMCVNKQTETHIRCALTSKQKHTHNKC